MYRLKKPNMYYLPVSVGPNPRSGLALPQDLLQGYSQGVCLGHRQLKPGLVEESLPSSIRRPLAGLRYSLALDQSPTQFLAMGAPP